MSKQKFITDLFKKRSTYLDPDQAELAANLLNTVSSDIYSESQRFIFELIQNADDAAISNNNEIDFDFYPDCLIVSHKGKAFDEPDIYAITNAGKGTKSSDITKTGYKGIGFKSVFGKSNKVIISSDGYCFRFDKESVNNYYPGIKMPWQIIPIWTDHKDIRIDQKEFHLQNNFGVSTIIDINNTSVLQNDLEELLSNGKILLFLRNISKISVSVNGVHVYSVEKQVDRVEASFKEVKLFKNTSQISQWIVYTFDNLPIDHETHLLLKQDNKTPDKLIEATYTEISFAAKIENKKIKPVKGEESLIFTYLPTKVKDFDFPFLVNANFLTNASREGIHEDRVWNQWLFSLIGEKIFDWIEMLSYSSFKFQVLQLLPSKFNSNQNDLKIVFDRSFEKIGKSKSFVLNKDFKLKKACDILIDRIGLSDEPFIQGKVIIDYINKVHNRSFTIDSFINSKLEFVNKLTSLGAFIFDVEKLEDFFLDEIFKSNHQISQNIFLIKYFFKRAFETDSKEWNVKIKSIPFIYSNDMKLKSPISICFPSIDQNFDYNNEIGSDISVIHNDVYLLIDKDTGLRKWLQQIGVDEPSDIAFIEREIINNIDSYINTDNCIEVTRYLFKQYKKGILSERHFDELKNLKIKTLSNELIPAGNCFFSNDYAPILRLQDFFDDLHYISKDYISEGYLSSDWKTFFILIGVKENISLGELKRKHAYNLSKDFNCFPEFFSENKGFEYTGYVTSFRSFHAYTIYKLTFIEKAMDFHFSKIFWENVLKNITPVEFSKCFRGHWGDYGNYGDITGHEQNVSYNVWLVNNKAIIPTSQKDCRHSSEVFINTKEIIDIAGKYLPVFFCEIIPDNEWLQIIPIKHTLEVDDYLLILLNISLDLKIDDEIKNSNKKRIGKIYNKLVSLLPSLSQKKKNIISEWAIENKLLCINDKFENPNELVYVKIAGLSYFSEHLKLLFIPDNFDTNSVCFEELLSLLGIKIIDKFIPNIVAPVLISSLKIQLQTILPFLVALIEKRQFFDYTIEYDRLSKIIDSAEFFNAQEISLSFKNMEEVISGPSLNAILIDKQLFFKSQWTSPLILYSLVPELSKLMQVYDINEELKLLISLDENEIKEWFVEQGFELKNILERPEYITTVEKIKSFTTEDDIEQSYDHTDNSDEKSRISISQDAKDKIFETLRDKGFYVPTTLDINYTIVNGTKNPAGMSVKLVVKSGKAGTLYFNPSEWLALSDANTQLFVVTRGNIVRNITLNNLIAVNDTFHMRFNTEAFAVDTHLKSFANFFRYLPYTHFLFKTPESYTDFDEDFGLNERNPSADTLSADDINLLK